MFTDPNLLTIFTTGLLTGGLTCIAFEGGLFTAALVPDRRIRNPAGGEARQGRQESGIRGRDRKLGPILAFVSAKLLVYTILGFFLGWIGEALQVSLQIRIALQFIIVIFMLGTALNLLNLHPIFRYFVIMPPRFLTNLAYKNTESKNLFAPILLGFLTVLIPCGATQAMMALAVATGNPVAGAVVMFVFILGTTPVFLLFGLAALNLRSKFNKGFLKFAGFAIIFLALFNLDATLALSNSPFTIRNTLSRVFCVFSYCSTSANLEPVDFQTITLTPTGYSPNHFAVRKGERVTLRLANENATGCIQSFTISSLNIQKIVLPNQTEDISFIAPNEPGKITFTCSSGLYPGTIEVI